MDNIRRRSWPSDDEGSFAPTSTNGWLTALSRYFVVIAVGNLAWEVLQLPLYTIWHQGSVQQMVFAVLHCTDGDLLIASATVLGALLTIADGRWPHDRYVIVAATAILGGIAYTIFNEWLNIEIRRSWAYTDLMPRLPLTGTGIAPLGQWIVVPLAAFWWARSSTEESNFREPSMIENRKRSTILVWTVFALALTSIVGIQAPALAGDMPQEEFERRVRDYLLANPEVIVQAVQGLEARQREAEESEAQAVLTARAEEILRDPASPVGGNVEGNVTLVEFFDYNCSYCRQMAPVMAEAEAADPQLRIVYKEFPILGPGSIFAAKAALAAHRQGRYETFHKALMQAKSKVTEATVLTVAAEVGLDVARVRADMQNPVIQAAIDRNLKLAEALRINGTPGFVIGDEILRGATDLATMKQLIEQARTKQK